MRTLCLLSSLLLCSTVYAQMGDHAPVDVREKATDFQKMKHFTGEGAEKKAHEFREVHGGIIVKDELKKDSFYLVRIPKDKIK